jgi:hypothetical protein
MTTIDRRSMLRVVLGSAAAAAAGLALIPNNPAEAAPGALTKSPAAGTELPLKKQSLSRAAPASGQGGQPA